MRTMTTKRIWVAAVALVLTGGLSACADEPMAPEESYEVQMDEKTSNQNCVVIDGQMICSN